jgi:hypothetical protein
MVPTVELPPDILATAQVTLVFEFPDTVAVNCCVLPGNKSAAAGETLIVAPDMMIIPTLATSLVFAWDTAVTVTCDGLGTVLGGV